MKPYRITIWNGGFVELGAFTTFDAALTAYRLVKNETKQLINVERADSGRDGLTDDERDQLAAEAA